MADMTTTAKNCKSTIIPGLRYRDAMAMIYWLCRAFGFESQAVYASPDGMVMHAQPTFGNGVIMVVTVNGRKRLANLEKQPEQIGGAETQAPYLVVSDLDRIYAGARTAGARILVGRQEKDHGGKAFSFSDPEGHIWHVGTLDPWESKQT